jgi:eukaryotic-like serine/threonine-protein kinase
MTAPRSFDPLPALRAGLAGRYEIERELGRGGMAVVYLARDLQHGRAVALKVLRPDLSAVGGAERFHREIGLSARLVHPNILPLLDSGSTAGQLWYTMPYVEGETLRTRLDRETQLPVDEAIRLTGEIADALGHAHSKGILHRDIKPENILLAGGHPLVADFGIARALGESTERITGTGFALGTPGYMSPEQSSGERELDARSDLYSLASVCYEMLAGEPPFTGPTAQAVIARRLSMPAPSLRPARPGIPETLDRAIRRALAPVPADRFATTQEFARALSAPETGETAVMPVRASRRWPLLAAVAVVLVIATAVWLLRSRGAGAEFTAADPAAGLRLAVLPFRLIGGDTNDRYLAAGMTEEITSTLSNLGGLRVIASSSVAQYAGSSRTPREIGAALGADALITGDLQKSGDAIRVRVQLIEPRTEESKWSQQYDHLARDVFQVQSEVASRVAGVLRIQLAERESQALSRPPTTNPEAYDQYLRALSRPNGDVYLADSALAWLSRAVALDSTFAAAWALQAEYLISTVFLFGADASRLDTAEASIARALALDSTQARAWKARGDLFWNAERGWHFRESLLATRHALALQPSLVAAHNALSALYFHYGFMDEGRAELMASLSLDPRDGCRDPTNCIGFSRPRVARTLWYQQKFDSALVLFDQLPFLGGWVWEKAVVLNGLGRPGEGLALLDSAATPGVREPADRDAARALLYAALGNPREALRHIELATARPNSRSHFHHAQFTIACAYARLGRKEDAVEWLRRTADNGMPAYPLFLNDPNLRSLRGDPGYERLMEELRQQFEANTRLVHG